MIDKDVVQDLITKLVDTNGKDVIQVDVIGSTIFAIIQVSSNKHINISIGKKKIGKIELYTVKLGLSEISIPKDIYNRLKNLLIEYKQRVIEKAEKEVIDYIYD